MRFAIFPSVSRAWLWPQWLLRNEVPSFNSILAHKDKTTMNNYCKKCRLRDGCLRKCKEAEIYEKGYNDGLKLNMRQEKEKDGIQRKEPYPIAP